MTETDIRERVSAALGSLVYLMGRTGLNPEDGRDQAALMVNATGDLLAQALVDLNRTADALENLARTQEFLLQRELGR